VKKRQGRREYRQQKIYTTNCCRCVMRPFIKNASGASGRLRGQGCKLGTLAEGVAGAAAHSYCLADVKKGKL